MTINLADNSPRVSYSVASGNTQTSFAVPFEFFADSDLNVYVDGVLKTISTHYTVSGGDGTTGTITMSVTGISGGSSVVFTRSVALERTSDFPTSGPFQIDALNTELDRITAIAADLNDKASRGLQLTDYDVSVDLVLPDLDDRKGTTLAFNASTGAAEAGPTISDVQSVADASADIQTLAHIEDGTVATDVIQTVAGIAANVTTVAGVAAAVTTVSGNTTNVNTVATNIADVSSVATNMAEVLNADTNAATATTKASQASASATAAQTAKTAAETAETNAETAEANAETAETNAATSASTATTQATASASSATAAATSETNADTSETNAGNSETAASNSATASANSATAASTSQTAAATSAAAAATALDSFDDRYLGSKSSDPTLDNDGDALVSGGLYFNSTANEMRVYDGANWIAASSAGAASLILYEYTATSGQTSFSGADDNSASLSYAVSNIQVVLNGVILDPSDYTATSGTSVVLASSAATGDVMNVYAFKSFTVADTVSASAGGTFAANINVDGTITSDGLTVDGNVGIGTSSPSQVLHLKDSGTNTILLIEAASSGSSAVRFADENDSNVGFVSYDHSDNSMQFRTDDTNQMLINSSGNVGIGTSSFPANGKNLKIEDSTISRLVLANTGDSTFEIGSLAGGILNIYDATADSERMRIDSSGNVLVGTASLAVFADTNDGVLMEPAGAVVASRNSNTVGYFRRRGNDGDIFTFLKDTTAVGSIGVVNGDAYIGNGNTTLLFKDGNDGIYPRGTEGVGRDGNIDFGGASNRWNDIYATNSTIQTSDRNEKQDIASLTPTEMLVAARLSTGFKNFKWKDKVAEKGDDARLHSGAIAQDVQDAFTAEGLDAGNYAMFISSTWWEHDVDVPAVEAVEASEDVEAVEAKDAYTRTDTYDTLEEAPEGSTERTRLGIRYPELLSFVAAYSEQRFASIETRLTALEA